MLRPIIFVLTIFLLQLLEIYGQKECCEGKNILSEYGGRCIGTENNSTEINFECSNSKVAVILYDNDVEQLFKWLKNGTMLNSWSDEPIEYCHSLEETTLVRKMVVCLEMETDEETISLIHSTLLIISIIFILLNIMVYLIAPSLLDQQGICIVHMLAGLALGHLNLVVLKNNQLPQHFCISTGYLVYFSYLYMFFWLMVLSFHIWRVTKKPHLTFCFNWMILYHIVGILGPLIMLSIMLVLHNVSEEYNRPLGDSSCWFSSYQLMWNCFYGPISICMLINLYFFISTIRHLWKEENNQNRNRVARYRVKFCFRMLIIMGITWFTDIFTFLIRLYEDLFPPLTTIIFILDCINLSQGVIMFLVLVVFRKRVRRSLASMKICNFQFPTAWRHLPDEEIDSEEDNNVNRTVIQFTQAEEDPKIEVNV